MIENPAKLFEEVQNEVAARIKARPLFAGLKFPDGSDFDVLTEDEGDPEMLFTQQVANTGLCILVQAPAGKFTTSSEVLYANPLVLAVSISEAVLFNRDPNITGNTKIRLMKAALEVLKAVHRYAPPIAATKAARDATLEGPRHQARQRRPGREPHSDFRGDRSIGRSRVTETKTGVTNQIV
jgi:hypothetical protein